MQMKVVYKGSLSALLVSSLEREKKLRPRQIVLHTKTLDFHQGAMQMCMEPYHSIIYLY